MQWAHTQNALLSLTVASFPQLLGASGDILSTKARSRMLATPMVRLARRQVRVGAPLGRLC